MKSVRTKNERIYFSTQTRLQVEIGLEVSALARQDLTEITDALKVLRQVVSQSLRRDEGWKEFYRERMDSLREPIAQSQLLEVFSKESIAERLFLNGEIEKAVNLLQEVVDRPSISAAEQGWFLQEMARYMYSQSKRNAEALQMAAHKRNRLLLKPRSLRQITKLIPIPQKRTKQIISWIKGFELFQDVMITVDEILSDLRFGVAAERFEAALDDLGKALGYATERPDREWKAGPDNLWAIRDGQYLLFECKSEVENTRREIHKHETGQMNNSSAWFAREYPGATVSRVLVIPTKQIGVAAGFTDDVRIMRVKGLSMLVRNVRNFFKEFHNLELKDISEKLVHDLLIRHHLDVESLVNNYTEDTQIVRG